MRRPFGITIADTLGLNGLLRPIQVFLAFIHCTPALLSSAVTVYPGDVFAAMPRFSAVPPYVGATFEGCISHNSLGKTSFSFLITRGLSGMCLLGYASV